MILIDGRARPSCFLHAIPKLKVDGYVILDNTERAHYYPAMRLAPESFEFIDLPGPTPYLLSFTRTSVWHRRV